MKLRRRRIIELLACCMLAFCLGCSISLMMSLGETVTKCSDFVPSLQAELLGSFREDHDNKKHSVQHFLAVLILSAPENTALRDVARRTWLSPCHQDVTFGCYFSVAADGLSSAELGLITEEGRRHRDILLVRGITDHYRNLTAKLLQSLVWLGYARSVSYVLKVDDDSFARLDRLQEELSRDPDPGLYWGYFDGRARPRKTGRWAEPGWVLCDHYLPYALGGGYVLGGQLVRYIATNSRYLQLFVSEDVSVGAWLGALKVVRRRHDPRFDTEYRSRGCLDTYLVTHKKGVVEMTAMWAELSNGTGRLCPAGVEREIHSAYSYDWTVPPSRCCVKRHIVGG